jgi:hypothetical protein
MPRDVLRVSARTCGQCGVRHRPRVQCAQQQSVDESQIASVQLLSCIINVTLQLFVCHLKRLLVEAKMRPTERPKLPFWRVLKHSCRHMTMNLHVMSRLLAPDIPFMSPILKH